MNNTPAAQSSDALVKAWEQRAAELGKHKTMGAADIASRECALIYRTCANEVRAALASAPAAEPEQVKPLPNVEFLAMRLGVVARLVGVRMPDMDNDGIAEVAGTILGQIRAAIEQERAGRATPPTATPAPDAGIGDTAPAGAVRAVTAQEDSVFQKAVRRSGKLISRTATPKQRADAWRMQETSQSGGKTFNWTYSDDASCHEAGEKWEPLYTTPQPNDAPQQGRWTDTDKIIRDFIEDYEMLGEDAEGRNACYTPNANERALLEDAINGFLADDAWNAVWIAYIEDRVKAATQQPQPAQTSEDAGRWQFVLEHACSGEAPKAKNFDITYVPVGYNGSEWGRIEIEWTGPAWEHIDAAKVNAIVDAARSHGVEGAD